MTATLLCTADPRAQELGAEHRYVRADLSRADGQEVVMKLLEQERFDLLVNNAGMGVDA